MANIVIAHMYLHDVINSGRAALRRLKPLTGDDMARNRVVSDLPVRRQPVRPVCAAVRVDMCAHMCPHTRAGCTEMYIDACTDMVVVLCVDICIGMIVEVRMDACVGKCVDMCIDIETLA